MAAYIGRTPVRAIIGDDALSDRIYLDHAATTPILPVVREAMAQSLAGWANPSSPHVEGRAARAALEQAREAVKAAYDWPHELIFTAGASESIRIAIRRAQAGTRLVGVTEHDAVLRAATDAVKLPVDPDGEIDLDALSERLVEAGEKPLVVVQWGNNETGVLQPLVQVAERVKAAGGLLFVDAAQMPAGWIDAHRPQDHADFIAVSAHKRGGPPGIGALLVRDFGTLIPTGGQERGYRGGTENLPAAIGYAAALSVPEPMTPMVALREWLDEAIEAAGGEVIAAEARRSPLVGAYRMPGVSSQVQLVRFDLAGIAVSAGSACSSGSMRPSHVLAQMGIEGAEAGEVVRVSFGRATSEQDLARFVAVWTQIADELMHDAFDSFDDSPEAAA